MKKVLFQLHWFFGITAGLVLALMGITGALYSFEDEILDALNPEALFVQPGEHQLSLGEMVSRLEAQGQDKVAMFRIEVAGDRAAQVWFKPAPGERRGEMHNFDPYTGEFKPDATGQDVFGFILNLHRFLAAGEYGKQVTAACTLILVFFCLSGLYLRWPRQALNWRVWLTLDWAKKGRSFNWDLHSVFGTWCLIVYLLLAGTGLMWSYDWFSNGMNKLIGDPPVAGEQRRGPGPRPAAGTRDAAPEQPVVVDYAAIQNTIEKTAGPGLKAYNLRLPQAAGQMATVFYLLNDAPHPRALNQITLDPADGNLKAISRYADKGYGAQLLISNYALHTGSYWGITGRIVVTLAAILMPLFFITGWLLYLDRRRKKREIRTARGEVGQAGSSTSGTQGPAWLIGFASQSGFAEQLAWQTAGQLQAAGLPVRVQRLADMTEHELQQSEHALFVVSTFGDGEAPDSARGFERRLLGRAVSLQHLNYAVLGLGDRQYTQFCGFARRLHDWLAERGASTLFAPVEVDSGDSAALQHWQQQLGELTGSTPASPWKAPEYENWVLSQRDWLNPDSMGSKVFLLGLISASDTRWQAGDLIEVLPRNGMFAVEQFLAGLGIAADTQVKVDGLHETLAQALGGRQLPANRSHLVGLHAQALVDALVPLAMREYSIASIPEDGTLQLIVRQEVHPDGSLGLGSGWLTEHAAVGDTISLRIRRNSSFHLASEPAPLILIGNGTGLAGLRSLLKARIAQGEPRNWLLFGERNVAHDFHCGDELNNWLASGDLARMDLAFSRDQAQKVYVQDRLREAADELRVWINEGAAIYICGSLEGMAGGVDEVLKAVLGEHVVQRLIEQGRYRRDVY
ncbi:MULTISPECIES: sulfite reductase flavoprotein subunit alpha [unclassified Pseudomonas]|uniref:sulfite reductase flavoprotein subunit alpha n=1 Tax=unclassified Pseudomonas TaxID=196821 RepID=UPI000D35FDC5|nr:MULTISPECIES: sulfite reductase flavoprotein subunit alpha [unclassified Pseudomonas]RAU49721.1 flavodoxin [Pseudomonas sp. RIT 409]RAU56350.1 flavodoxin [Pseudomonas sp. RIT 412]